MKKQFSRLRAPVLVVATAVACLSVHELGHVLAAWATGARVASIDILSIHPHVSVVGPGSPASQSLRAIAGSGLMLTAWLACMLAVPRRRAHTLVIETASFFALVEVLGWLLSSLLHNVGAQANDATAFLAFSGADPRLVVLTCVLLLGAGTGLLAIRQRASAPIPVQQPATQAARAASAGS